MNVMNVKRKHDEDSAGEKRKGRKKGFVWSHVLTDEEGKVTCMHSSPDPAPGISDDTLNLIQAMLPPAEEQPTL